MRRITLGIVKALASIGLTPDTPDLRHRLQLTVSGAIRKLLSANFKVVKGEGRGILTTIQQLAPAKQSGVNLCAFSGACEFECIDKTGQNVTEMARIARVSRTLLFVLFPEEHLRQLEWELRSHQLKAEFKGMVPAARLNGTSDWPWERYGFMQRLPEIQFYDYSKWPLDRRNPPDNYHLTYSVSELPGSMELALEYLERGHNAAIVVQSEHGSTRTTAKEQARRILDAGELHGFPVITGDDDDVRFMDPPGHWVVLYAKGPATKDPGVGNGGFVYRGHPRLTIAA